MKKSKICSLAAIAVLAACGLASCGNTNSGDNDAVKAAIADAESMSRADLFKKASEEIGSGTLKFVGTSSRFKNSIDPFKAELAKYNPDCANMTITKDSKVDGQIYTSLLGEIEAGVKNGYDGALVQDGYQLQKKGIDTGFFLNYIPKEWNDDPNTNKELNGNPFALQYNMKTWMVNNAGGNTTTIDNVWDITADAWKGKLQTMDPRNENVNMDWLITLTKDSWCDQLKTAFEDSSNDNKSLDLTKYASYGEKKKYAYAFMDGYLTNSVFNADDGAARDNITNKTAAGNGGWIVYSKIGSVKESENVSVGNITISALGKDNTDGNTPTSHIKGFGGFMYKHYLQVMKTTSHPYTVCAFINYLSTTETGYAAWGKDIGDYPSLPSINVDRTKYGHGTLDTSTTPYTFTQDNTKDNVFSALNDPKSSWWESATGGNVVIEDPAYIVTQYNAVRSFIDTVIANKK
jgi:hypothetical protein